MFIWIPHAKVIRVQYIIDRWSKTNTKTWCWDYNVEILKINIYLSWKILGCWLWVGSQFKHHPHHKYLKWMHTTSFYIHKSKNKNGLHASNNDWMSLEAHDNNKGKHITHVGPLWKLALTKRTQNVMSWHPPLGLYPISFWFLYIRKQLHVNEVS